MAPAIFATLTMHTTIANSTFDHVEYATGQLTYQPQTQVLAGSLNGYSNSHAKSQDRADAMTATPTRTFDVTVPRTGGSATVLMKDGSSATLGRPPAKIDADYSHGILSQSLQAPWNAVYTLTFTEGRVHF